MLLVENDVRLMRQFLLALEEGRAVDADLIWNYLIVMRELRLTRTTRSEVADSWLRYWQVPGTVNEMIVMKDYGNEPVYRIPAAVAGPNARQLGSMEVPLQVPPELDGSLRLGLGPLPLSITTTDRRRSWLSRILFG